MGVFSYGVILFGGFFVNGPKGAFKALFGPGTAAVISPVGELKCGDTIININHGEIGPISQMLYDKITGMQFGKLPDEFGWTVEVK